MEKHFTKNHSMMAKGLAILLLLFYHLFYEESVVTAMQVNYAPMSLQNFLMVAGFGNICVAVFVIITAYGITKSILDAPDMSWQIAGSQACKRFLKLMAGFAALYFSVIIVWFYKFDLASLYGKGKQGVLLLLCDALGLAQFLNTPILNHTWWYMPLAYTLIFMVPILAFCVKKVRYALLPMAFFLPMLVDINNDMRRYLFVAVFGVCAAYGNWFDKVLNLKSNIALKWIAGIIGFVLCILVRQNAVVKDYFLEYVDAPVAFFVICFAVVILGSVPGIRQALSFLGKYSMNMYLVHTFFYMILFRDFIYQFKYAPVIFLVLVLVSLAYAVCLELLKKVAGKGLGLLITKLKRN